MIHAAVNNDAERMVDAKRLYRGGMSRLEQAARITNRKQRQQTEDFIVEMHVLLLRQLAFACRGQNRRQHIYRKIRTLKAQPWNN